MWEKIRWNKILLVYLRKTWFKLYQDPDPHSSKMLDPEPYPDPHIINVDPKHGAVAISFSFLYLKRPNFVK
jgi:hypothetical protein